MHKQSGFTLIEMIIAVAIIGILSLGSYSSILNSVEVRNLDNAARDIVSSLQQAKWQSVTDKLNHRLRFINTAGVWTYLVETENPAGTWTTEPRIATKRVPTRFTVGMNLPSGNVVIFTPIGFVSGYNSALNTVTVTSAKLGGLSQPNRWTIRVLASGSFQLIKTSAG
jgi:prepilin-type N-terminal cleavage/methylation domain-containing protein